MGHMTHMHVFLSAEMNRRYPELRHHKLESTGLNLEQCQQLEAEGIIYDARIKQ
jgi:hypothetical protein